MKPAIVTFLVLIVFTAAAAIPNRKAGPAEGSA